MPGQTYYNMGVKDFFYNDHTADNIKMSIPFDTKMNGKFNTWLSTNHPGILYDGNVFFKDAVQCVIDNRTNFIHNFLPGNIVLSQTINQSVSNITGGNLVVNSNSFDLPPAVNHSGYDSYNIYEGSDYTDGNQYMLLNSNGDSTIYNKKGINKNDGRTRTYITLNTGNPKCLYTANCTEKHHYNNCHTQIGTNKDGTTYCKCVCNATGFVGDGTTPHTHCTPTEFNSSTTLITDFANRQYNVKNSKGKQGSKSFYDDYMTNSNLLGTIQNIKLNLNLNPDTGDKKSTVGFSENTCVLIYDYYTEVYRNIDYQNQIQGYESSPTEQALTDANNLYKHKYLDLFNIFSGILLASSYIYILTRK
jgi:hypothetical protein